MRQIKIPEVNLLVNATKKINPTVSNLPWNLRAMRALREDKLVIYSVTNQQIWKDYGT
ncbi:MAG: hypothetical protein WBE34_18890 [Candidatus Nitrosopolaris sp.]